MTKILFVCHGNICCSPMAEFLFWHLAEKRGRGGAFSVASAATSREEIGNGVHPGTRRVLARYGIDPSGKRAVQLTAADYGKYDLLLGMDSANVRNMLRILGGDPEHKVCRLLDLTSYPRDIADPWYTGDFEATLADILEGCDALLARYSGR